MTSPTAQPEIWFLTGSQELYGAQTLQQVADQSRQLAALLDASPDIAARVTWKPVLTSATCCSVCAP